MSDPNVYDQNAAYWAETFTYDGLGRQLTAQKVSDGSVIAASVFAYNDLGLLTSEAQTLFAGTERTVTYGYDQFGYRTSIGYPDGTTTITRTNTWDGRIDGLSRGGAALAGYDYLGRRVAWRAYNTTTPVVAAYSYDMLGRVAEIDADTGRVKLTYDYVPQEHNIAQIRFDHRPGTPYNSYGYDDLDRVTQVTYLNNDTEAFPMDDLGGMQLFCIGEL